MTTSTTSIDLNCDMGELIDGRYNYDEDIIPYISSCNISCGFHSGDPALIEKTIISAIKNNVAIGAHPSYNDKNNFGRKSLNIPISQLQSEIKYQVSAIKGMVESHGGTLHHVKAHGALYNDMHKDENLAEAIITAICQIQENIIIYAMAESRISDMCKKLNVSCKNEVFSDRTYESKTILRSREYPDALITDYNNITQRINHIINNQIEDIHGILHDITADTICLHSDTPGAVEIAKNLFHYLSERNIEISPNRK